MLPSVSTRLIVAAYLTCTGIPIGRSSCPEHADNEVLLLQRSVALGENIGAPAESGSHEEDWIAGASPGNLEDEIASLEQDIKAFERNTQAAKAQSSFADVSLARTPAYASASTSITLPEDPRARAQASHNTEEFELRDQREKGHPQAMLNLQQQVQRLDQALHERALLSLQQERLHLDEALKEQERELNSLRIQELAQDLERLQGSKVGRDSASTDNSTDATTDESTMESMWAKIYDWMSTHTGIVGAVAAIVASICIVVLVHLCGCSVTDMLCIGMAFGMSS